MRFFWSVVLTGGLLLIGIDGYESREEARMGSATSDVALAEDGTPFPPPPPPPPQ